MNKSLLLFLSLIMLLGQSSGSLDNAAQIVSTLAPVLSQIAAVVILIAIPILVFHILMKEVIGKL